MLDVLRFRILTLFLLSVVLMRNYNKSTYHWVFTQTYSNKKEDYFIKAYLLDPNL